jgi:hypothetical protein
MTDAILAITAAGSSLLFSGLLVASSCNIELTAYRNEEALFTFIADTASHN